MSLPPIHGLMFIQTLREVKWGDRYNTSPSLSATEISDDGKGDDVIYNGIKGDY